METLGASRPYLWTVKGARKQIGGADDPISHSGFYNLVGKGLIRLTKIGRRSYITDEELRSLPERLDALDE